MITIYSFQAIYFLVYYYFFFEKYALHASKMVGNYNQHLVSEITGILLIYSDLPASFVVA